MYGVNCVVEVVLCFNVGRLSQKPNVANFLRNVQQKAKAGFAFYAETRPAFLETTYCTILRQRNAAGKAKLPTKKHNRKQCKYPLQPNAGW